MTLLELTKWAEKEATLKELRGLLWHPESVVREGVLYGLQRLGELSYVELFREDPSPGIRDLVVDICGELSPSEMRRMLDDRAACLKCGSKEEWETTTGEVEFYSLPGVTLRGVPIERCPSCGDEGPVYSSFNGLEEVLARSLVSSPGRLTGDEIRFLRNSMGFSADEMASVVDEYSHTYEEWESGICEITDEADRVMREQALLDLTEIGSPSGERVRSTVVEYDGEDWKIVS